MVMQLFRNHQLNIMLVLCGACGLLSILLFFTRFLPRRRKVILVHMQLVAFFLLFFDRLAYIYAGDPSFVGYIMVRVSNFVVFFLTSAIVFVFNRYLIDLFEREGEEVTSYRILKIVEAMSELGMIMAVIAAFTNLYYYFDVSNKYHRGSAFLISYIIPVIAPIMQFAVIRKNRKTISHLIYISLVLYIFVPIACGILQIFAYGTSIVNMAMVIVSICLYIFTYLDINNTVEHAHEIEIQNMQSEKERMQRVFSQMATALVTAAEKRDDYSKGNATQVAEYSMKIAKLCGKDELYCSRVYYTALLHDVGMIGITDKVIESEDYSKKLEFETNKHKAIIGQEVLSNITEYPYLSEGAYFSHANYDGTGFPE